MRYCLLVTLLCSTIVLYAQHSPARLIVRGDDMGFSHSGNLAAVKTYKEGIVRSVEVLVPSPWFPEAVQLLKDNPGVDVGIHLTLTSEWDNVKWRPLSDCPSLKDDDGYFYPMIWPNKDYPNRALLQHKWKIEDVEKEFRAQIELALKKIPRISHVSGHMGCTHLNEEVAALTKRLAKEYNIDIDLPARGVKSVSYKGASKTPAGKKKAFIAMLQTLEAGNTYLFVDHPAFDTPEMRAIHHIGYEDVAMDRQGVVDIWTDAEIMALIKKKNIQLISYKDLLAE
ncbi:polysaccharide deacetylase family protein [Agriterribacter sp.]|uniref:polysaccharide deacetylase family protein n=1 Tax=Agriterribacter sp. TaxID=2821509 RepID=UPI002C6C83FD|nr:polysaccharide deacetylase family protein [Agriterribacter sp.]HRP57877.1 polysaccharide deacetylase family protein [Agriterribacter sp.]